jgi:hypothetical protein
MYHPWCSSTALYISVYAQKFLNSLLSGLKVTNGLMLVGALMKIGLQTGVWFSELFGVMDEGLRICMVSCVKIGTQILPQMELFILQTQDSSSTHSGTIDSYFNWLLSAWG